MGVVVDGVVVEGVVVVGLPPCINDLAGSMTGGEELRLVRSICVTEPGMRTSTLDTYSPVIV